MSATATKNADELAGRGDVVNLADRLVAQFAQLPQELRELVVERMALKLAARALGAEVTSVELEAKAVAPEPAGDYRAPRFATVEQMCRELGFKRTWAYEHKRELGAIIMPTKDHEPGASPTKRRKSHMRFDMEVARDFWSSLGIAESGTAKKPASRRRTPSKRRTGSETGAPARRPVPGYKFT